MALTVSSKSYTFYEGEDYGIRIEYNADYVIIHILYVHKFTKGTYLDMVNRLQDFWDFCHTMGHNYLWAAIDPDNQKLAKMIGKIGWVYRGTSDNMAVFSFEGKNQCHQSQ